MAWGPTPTLLAQLTPRPQRSRYALGFGLFYRPARHASSHAGAQPWRRPATAYLGIADSHPAMSDGLTPFIQPSKS
jgi:hypothetical protein